MIAPIRFATVAAIAFAAASIASPAPAQQLDLPAPSPLARVMQRVGLTDVTVEYSSPMVKGRKIWGTLVPFDKIWRTGANSTTKVTFSKDVSVAGKAVPAGTYALFTIPGKTKWTVILSNKPEQNSQGTDFKEDMAVARFDAKPQGSGHRERLLFLFTSTTDDTTSLDLEWEKLRVSIPIKANTEEQALASIKSAVNGGWRIYNRAGRYLYDRKQYDEALKHVDTSLMLQQDWQNVWTKAQITAAKGDTKEAVALAQKAQEMGGKNPAGFFLADDVKKAITEWEKKSNEPAKASAKQTAKAPAK